MDDADPLRGFRDRFLFASGSEADLVYLDGNSLGRLPLAAQDRLRQVIDDEWGVGLVRTWDSWISLAGQAGDLLATSAIDARPGEVVLSDSTSVNLYKLASAALEARPGRRVIVTDDDNFPTDRYVLAGLADRLGYDLRFLTTDIDSGLSLSTVSSSLTDEVALVALSHVAYRSGAVADMGAITAAVHDAGALMLWDLSHSVGALPVPLNSSNVDLAVGCTYKYLNGGPGSPAFLFVREDLQAVLRQPIWGWFSQQDQFAMGPVYEPVSNVERFLVGTPTVLGVVGALEGIRITAEAGIEAIADKARALTSYAVELSDEWLVPLGFRLASPRDPMRRGAHITLHHEQAWQISQALRGAGVIADFRMPDRLRLGFAPLYTRFADVHEGLQRIRDIVSADRHLSYPSVRARVS
jgi:kynureninase